MGQRAKPVVVIPYMCEVWQGLQSLGRVRELESIGIAREEIARRFGVTLQTIRNYEARERRLASPQGATYEQQTAIGS